MRTIFRRPNIWQASPRAQQNGSISSTVASICTRWLHLKPRQYRSNLWIPQATLAQQNEAKPDANELLVRAGYFRQAYSGIFHMLPLGLRVQSKIERLVDKHMQSLQASKVSLSSISSQKLWHRSGRLDKGSEFFKFKDRKDANWLLAPTHEEEITSLVKEIVHAPGHLPIRLYQITRKYRDEKRPRGGLLRGREFIMKDLYTFDKTETEAHATYDNVRQAYSNLFDELKIPYIEARADSGNMGGNLSHEFHFPSNLGEDDIITCSTCEYAKNEEFVHDFTTVISQANTDTSHETRFPGSSSTELVSRSFSSKNHKSLIKAYATSKDSPVTRELNPFAVKECFDAEIEVDTGVTDAEASFALRLASAEENNGLKVYYVFDQFVNQEVAQAQVTQDSSWLQENNLQAFIVRIDDSETHQSHLLKRKTGDACPECSTAGRPGTLSVTKAIEVGHTFHLGSRYSSKFDLVVPKTGSNSQTAGSPYVSMGCHGIGVSRLIAAVASASSDSVGLMWPRVIAPFEVLIVVNTKQKELAETVEIGSKIYDELSAYRDDPIDVMIDDRQDVDFGWKLKDADLIGYPVVVVIGKGWQKKKLVEIQCRRLKVKEEATLEAAPGRIQELLRQL